MTIYIEDLTFDAIIGILDEERVHPQKVVINCTIDYDYKSQDFINYALITQLIEEEMQKGKFLLIENAILEIIDKIKARFSTISSIKLKISKPNILDNCVVSAELEKKY